MCGQSRVGLEVVRTASGVLVGVGMFVRRSHVLACQGAHSLGQDEHSAEDRGYAREGQMGTFLIFCLCIHGGALYLSLWPHLFFIKQDMVR